MQPPPRLVTMPLDDVPEEEPGSTAKIEGAGRNARVYPSGGFESGARSGASTPTQGGLQPVQGRPRKSPSVRTLGRPSNDQLAGPSGHTVRRSASSSAVAPLGGAGAAQQKTARVSSAGHQHSSAAGNGNRYRSTPRLAHDKDAKETPATGMHWSKAPVWGSLPARTLRAHTITLIDGVGWIIGGSEDKDTTRDVYCFDTETFQWSHPTTTGTPPPPCRAHTATLVDRTKILIYGGGLGSNYFDSIYILDTATRHWTSPPVHDGPKPKGRRAHTAVWWNGKIWIFGGGNGLEALNDVWCLDVGPGGMGVQAPLSGSATPTSHYPPGSGPRASRGSAGTETPEHRKALRWEEVHTSGGKPGPRGYHSATLVGDVMIVVGGSDGKECFTDIWLLNFKTLVWTMIKPQVPPVPQYKRLSHSATQVGSYLFIVAGHNGQEYCSEVLLFNLVSLQFEPRTIYGKPPSSRGNHATILADSRVFLFGGFNGQHGLEDVHIMDLGVSAYLPQVTSFEIDPSPEVVGPSAFETEAPRPSTMGSR